MIHIVRYFRASFQHRAHYHARLTHQIISPLTLNIYLRVISYGLQKYLSNYQIVFQHMDNYYAEPPVSCTKSSDKLLAQISNLLKHVSQVPLLLYIIWAVPVPKCMFNILYNDFTRLIYSFNGTTTQTVYMHGNSTLL